MAGGTFHPFSSFPLHYTTSMHPRALATWSQSTVSASFRISTRTSLRLVTKQSAGRAAPLSAKSQKFWQGRTEPEPNVENRAINKADPLG